MTMKEYEVVRPLPKHEPSWYYVPNDQLVARLTKYPNDVVKTTYRGIDCVINRLPNDLYRIRIGGRRFTVNRTELRQFTMTK